MRLTPPSPSIRLALPAVALALVVTGCSGGTDEPGTAAPSGETAPAESSEEAVAPTESPTADVPVPDGVEVTAQGSDLGFGDTATVVFEPDQRRDSLIELTVTKAREGRIADFAGFILDDDYKKKAHYFYVDVTVENVGEGNVGGSPVPLWGVNGDNTLLPAVNFTTKFKPCASTSLPKKFKSGDKVKTCLVYLSPDKGSLDALSFRPDQAFDPIEWNGKVKAAPKPAKGKGKKGKNKNRNS
ncbi:MAG: hypothetical protein WBQ50_02780 [Nocardioides sp.]